MLQRYLYISFMLITLLAGCGTPSDIVMINASSMGIESVSAEVAPRDPASIVLKRVRVEEHAAHGDTNSVAVLVRMQSNSSDAEADKWVLA